MELFEIVFGDFVVKVLFYGFHGKDFDGLKYFCGYLIMLCSIILLLIIYKTSRASKSLVWVWGITLPPPVLSLIAFSSFDLFSCVGEVDAHE